jgi:type II secretion system protein E
MPEQELKALAKRLGIPYVRIKSADIDKSLAKTIPARFVTHGKFMPLREDNGAVVMAVSNPLDVQALDEIELMLKRQVRFVISPESDIAKAIEQYYGIGAETVEAMLADKDGKVEVLTSVDDADENIEDMAEDASIIKFVNQIMFQAVQDRATDIHLEPFEDELKVRYRIDGMLYEVAIPPAIKHLQSAIISRIKIMSHLNIAERRLPQDGRIKIKTENKEFDLRVSILPGSNGEFICIRILSRSDIFYGLGELGFSDEELRKFESVIKKPHGIVLVTGPTGSGKTTTLYAALSRLNSGDRKIITIEDPIEYRLKGICQMQVHPKIGFDFANAFRSMLRHDPDIMMVGEIRDLETAEIAVHTALTGHLVFSTLHTNDAAGAIARLHDIGIKPYLIASSVECIMAQRLVRLICPDCREKYEPAEESLREIGMNPGELGEVEFYRGKGCEKCKYTGYFGRTGIYEILLVDNIIRDMILNREPSNIIKQRAQESGMNTLSQDGWQKVVRGITTIDEILRVAFEG